MRFLLTGDWHVTKNRPENRKDDYWKTVQRKVRWLSDTAIEKKVSLILQAGDMFDSHRVSMDVVGWIGALFTGGVWKRIWSIEGQHDVPFHNLDNPNNPHRLLVDTGVIFNPRLPQPDHPGGIYRIQNDPVIDIAGAAWGEDIPEIVNKNAFNILITHRMVIKDRRNKLWKDQKEYDTAPGLLKKHPYDLIVSGDNHQSFISEYQGRYLINTGSLLRSTIAQGDHRPFVVIFDTEDPKSFEKIYVPIEPFEEVMDLEKRERKKIADERLDVFVKKLKGTESEELDYKSNVWELAKESSVSNRTKSILKTIFE